MTQPQPRLNLCGQVADDLGRRVECPRFGTVTCGEHIEAERELYDKYFDGRRISPRHIVLDLEGTNVLDTTSADVLTEVVTSLRQRGVDVYFVRLRYPVRVLLRRAGNVWNHKKVWRVYCAMKLNKRRKFKRRRQVEAPQPLVQPIRPNQAWSADFMSDALLNGRRFRTFNVVDDFNRQALHIEVDTSITSMRLVRIFERLQAGHGLPQVLRTDNGPEFLGEAFTSWAKNAGMAIQYIQPGRPNQNAYIERFNRTYREELLNQHLFLSLADVREATHWWMIEYNEERPHDALGDLTPMEARQQAAENSSFELSH